MADPFTFSHQDSRPRTRRRQRARPPRRQLVVRTSGLAAGVVVISVDGEIDLANRAELAGGLSRAAADPKLRLLVCDLTRVGFLACTGVSALADARSELAGRGAELRVVAIDPVVLRVLEVTGQRELLGLRPHLAAALAGFVPPPSNGRPIKLARRSGWVADDHGRT